MDISQEFCFLVTHEDGPVVFLDGRAVSLAKLITGAGPDETVIYRNGNPLDNRRKNLWVIPTAMLPDSRWS